MPSTTFVSLGAAPTGKAGGASSTSLVLALALGIGIPLCLLCVLLLLLLLIGCCRRRRRQQREEEETEEKEKEKENVPKRVSTDAEADCGSGSSAGVAWVVAPEVVVVHPADSVALPTHGDAGSGVVWATANKHSVDIYGGEEIQAWPELEKACVVEPGAPDLGQSSTTLARLRGRGWFWA